MTVVAIHQPEYFPWLGFLDKAKRSDVLVLLDNVQFDRSSTQHRTKILGANGPFWLTIPFVHRFPQRIDELEFADGKWATKHWKSLQASYGRAPAWKAVAPKLEAFFGASRARVMDALIASVELLLDGFGARPPRLVRASSLQAGGQKGELVLALCRELGASVYLSGKTGAAYLDNDAFAAAGIEVRVQRFAFPPYRGRELGDDERRGLSALDAWAFAGDDARHLLGGPA